MFSTHDWERILQKRGIDPNTLPDGMYDTFVEALIESSGSGGGVSSWKVLQDKPFGITFQSDAEPITAESQPEDWQNIINALRIQADYPGQLIVIPGNKGYYLCVDGEFTNLKLANVQDDKDPTWICGDHLIETTWSEANGVEIIVDGGVPFALYSNSSLNFKYIDAQFMPSGYHPLPDFGTWCNGKVLGVVDGQLEWVDKA